MSLIRTLAYFRIPWLLHSSAGRVVSYPSVIVFIGGWLGFWHLLSQVAMRTLRVLMDIDMPGMNGVPASVAAEPGLSPRRW